MYYVFEYLNDYIQNSQLSLSTCPHKIELCPYLFTLIPQKKKKKKKKRGSQKDSGPSSLTSDLSDISLPDKDMERTQEEAMSSDSEESVCSMDKTPNLNLDTSAQSKSQSNMSSGLPLNDPPVEKTIDTMTPEGPATPEKDAIKNSASVEQDEVNCLDPPSAASEKQEQGQVGVRMKPSNECQKNAPNQAQSQKDASKTQNQKSKSKKAQSQKNATYEVTSQKDEPTSQKDATNKTQPVLDQNANVDQSAYSKTEPCTKKTKSLNQEENKSSSRMVFGPQSKPEVRR